MPKVGEGIAPYWSTTDREMVRLYHGDVTKVLRRLPTQSVQCVVTSPPYWGLRDYGTGVWEGGDPTCNHKRPSQTGQLHEDRHGKVGVNNTNWDHRHEEGYGKVCGKCGARQVMDMQLGSEPSSDCGTQGKAQCGRCFVCSMVGVFREVRRVLRDDGTLWLNLGDTYESRGNLVGIPWRVALALQADGWILRQDIVWHKPSPMPESVKNRCTKAHEYIFLLVKKQGYYYDAEAIREPHSEPWRSTGKVEGNGTKGRAAIAAGANQGFGMKDEGGMVREYNSAGRNKRSVWTVSSQGYEGAHFATFPPRLIEPCILAGTSEKGCCSKCGTPWKRVVEEKKLTRERPNDYVKRTGEEGTGNSCSNSVAGVEVKTVGWEAGCSCGSAVVPCIVCDPFIGSGTTCVVAIEHGRRSVGIDLSEEYLKNNAIPRIEGCLLGRPGMSGLAGRKAEAVEF